MREIFTERLVLNNITRQDIDNVYELMHDYKRNEYYRYDHQWPEAYSEYENIIKSFASEDNYLAVRLKREGVFIGLISLTKEDDKNINLYNLGFIFNSKFQNKGYASEACTAYINEIRSLYIDVKFITGTAKSNIPANKLLKKLGFRIVKENEAYFQFDEKNNPINFEAYEYFLG
jgi:[ribosomal protein S5]-alanine N-acetyltransferase